MEIWTYTILSVIAISLISLVGAFTLPFRKELLEKILIYVVSFSVGTLLGDAFIHLIPEAFKEGESLTVSISILAGMLTFFVLEKFVHWQHCHEVASEDHPHIFSKMVLVGDSLHNFIDGMIIAGSFLVSVPIGIATTLAVIFHEIPQEIGNFGSLIYGGFTRGRALLFNFLTALTAVLGAIIVLVVNNSLDITKILIPFAAGGFIYIASADLIPELHRHTEEKKTIIQLISLILGIGFMIALL